MHGGDTLSKEFDCLKKKHEPHQQDEQLGHVGMGYYNRFMKQFGKFLESTADQRFAVNRSDWLKPGYLETMYNAIYSIFADAGVASSMVEPVAYDISGSLVEVGSPFQYGLPCKIIIHHKDFILFGDETGINTNQMDDGQVDGTKYVVPHGCVPLIQANSSEHRANVLPFTAASGDSVICVVIVENKRKHVDSTWHTGIDNTVDPILNLHGLVDTRNTDNHSPMKHFHSGPVCHFGGKEIPTLTFTTHSASI